MIWLDLVYLIVNITLGLVSLVLNARYFLKYKYPWRWVKLASGVISFVWSVLFALFLIGVFKIEAGSGQNIFFMAITFTQLTLAVGAIITYRRDSL